MLRTAASSCGRSRIGRRRRRGTVRLEAPAGLAVSPPAIILLGFLRRRPACSLEQGTLKFQAAAARMHAMDPRAARVSFLGEVVVAVFVASDDGLLAGAAFSLGGGGRVMV